MVDPDPNLPPNMASDVASPDDPDPNLPPNMASDVVSPADNPVPTMAEIDDPVPLETDGTTTLGTIVVALPPTLGTETLGTLIDGAEMSPTLGKNGIEL